MVKSGLEFFILNSPSPSRVAAAQCKKILPRKAELAWQVSRYQLKSLLSDHTSEIFKNSSNFEARLCNFLWKNWLYQEYKGVRKSNKTQFRKRKTQSYSDAPELLMTVSKDFSTIFDQFRHWRHIWIGTLFLTGFLGHTNSNVASQWILIISSIETGLLMSFSKYLI